MASEAQVLEITELRLGLPGGCPEKHAKKRVRKSQGVIGWPPICSYRQRCGEVKCHGLTHYVKVGSDGVPFLRKLDLCAYEGYVHLESAINGLFEHPGTEKTDCREYIHIYEDTEGDWMLVGDVPWGMFVQSCRKIRVMKSSEENTFKTHAKSPGKRKHRTPH
ncbi:Auxin-induced protein IAA6 [Acorus gramineus]|uniref:Auxin-responsive protein n=1 Tax=Acorus gramineus TaxID=55184 RepID=A0AAV9B9C9_ACOGR|nr:Auxin-induced protein IAA6 [Acorus gramineus]